MSGRYERAGGAVGFGLGAGVGAFAHVYVLANLISYMREARASGELPPAEPAKKVSIFSDEGILQLEISGYIVWMLVGSVVLAGLGGYFIGKKIGGKIDDTYPL